MVIRRFKTAETARFDVSIRHTPTLAQRPESHWRLHLDEKCNVEVNEEERAGDPLSDIPELERVLFKLSR